VPSKRSLGRREEWRGSPDLIANRAGDTGARGVTRRARATSSKSARLAFARTPRPANCPVHASGTHRRKLVRGGSWLAGLRGGNASRDQRNRHRLVPASSGAKAPLACEGRTLVGCARASFQVAEVGKRHRGPEKRVSRWQRGAWTGAQPSRVRKDSGGRKGVENRHRGGQAAKPGNSGAGRSRGRCGAKVLVRWKASRTARSARVVHAIESMVVSAAFTGAYVARAT